MTDEIPTECDTDLIAEFDEVPFESDVANEAGNVDEERKEYVASYLPLGSQTIDSYITRSADTY